MALTQLAYGPLPVSQAVHVEGDVLDFPATQSLEMTVPVGYAVNTGAVFFDVNVPRLSSFVEVLQRFLDG